MGADWILSARSMHPSQLYFSQAQRICNYRNRAEAHGAGGDDGAEENSDKWIQHSRRDGNAQRVVDEGKEQVLADVAHGDLAQAAGAHDSTQIAFDQGYAATLDGNIGPGPHGDSHIRLRQSGRVI